MKSLKGYIKIPVEMCNYALIKRFVRPFQIYVYLNCKYSGKVSIDTRIKKAIANDLGLKSVRTINNNLKLLTELGWITYSQKSKLYFIKGIDSIRKDYEFKSKSAVEFSIKEILYFKAFLGGVVISYIINSQKKRERQSAEHNKSYKSRSKKLIAQPFSFYPISCVVLANILNMSPTTAQRLKQLAHESGYLEVKKNLIDTGIHVRHYRSYIKFHPEEIIRIKNNKLFHQGADLVRSNMHFRSRKKIETLIRATYSI